MMWAFDGGWGWGMGLGWIVPLAFLGTLAWMAVTLVRRSDSNATGSKAMMVLKERYARGEVTREVFETMRRDIER